MLRVAQLLSDEQTDTGVAHPPRGRTSARWRGAYVAVPSDYADETYVYRVLVRMLWYRTDGSVQGKARHAVNHYATLTDGQSDGGERDICYGWMAWVGH